MDTVSTIELPPATQKLRREGMERITVHANGCKTSVSMDGVLFHFLSGRLGGAKEVQAWAQKVALDVEDLERRGVVMPPRDVDASLSRLIQRQALRLLWGGGA